MDKKMSIRVFYLMLSVVFVIILAFFLSDFSTYEIKNKKTEITINNDVFSSFVDPERSKKDVLLTPAYDIPNEENAAVNLFKAEDESNIDTVSEEYSVSHGLSIYDTKKNQLLIDGSALSIDSNGISEHHVIFENEQRYIELFSSHLKFSEYTFNDARCEADYCELSLTLTEKDQEYQLLKDVGDYLIQEKKPVNIDIKKDHKEIYLILSSGV